MHTSWRIAPNAQMSQLGPHLVPASSSGAICSPGCSQGSGVAPRVQPGKQGALLSVMASRTLSATLLSPYERSLSMDPPPPPPARQKKTRLTYASALELRMVRDWQVSAVALQCTGSRRPVQFFPSLFSQLPAQPSAAPPLSVQGAGPAASSKPPMHACIQSASPAPSPPQDAALLGWSRHSAGITLNPPP